MKKGAKLNGPQKAAALLLTLDAEAAANMLATLPDESITAVGRAMVDLDLGEVERSQISAIHSEFIAGVREGASIPPGLLELLEKTVGPERARGILSRIEETTKRERPFVALERLDNGQLARTLVGEHPQVIALVCSRIPADRAGAVLGGLGEDERLDVVTRLATMQPLAREVVDEVAGALGVKAEAQKSIPIDDPAKRLRSVAEILNNADATVEKGIFEALEAKDAEMAKAIRDKMFTFEDLATLDKRGMQKVLSSIDARALAMALKAADPAVVENVFANMTKRVKEMVAEERELLGAVPLSDVVKAQDEIMISVRGLIEKGELRPMRGGAANLIE